MTVYFFKNCPSRHFIQRFGGQNPTAQTRELHQKKLHSKHQVELPWRTYELPHWRIFEHR